MITKLNSRNAGRLTVLILLGMIPPAFASTPLPSNKAKGVAIDHLRTNAHALGLTAEDVADIEVSYLYSSRHNGVTHVYLRQRYQGVQVAGADMTVNVASNGDVHLVGHRFLSDLESRVVKTPPSLSKAAAVTKAEADQGSSQASAEASIPATLVYHLMPDGSLRHAWEVQVDTRREPRFCGIVVIDAATGEVLERRSWTSQLTPETLAAPGDRPANYPSAAGSQAVNPDSYLVFAIPKEHPDDGPRTVELNPALAGGPASPFNWHDTNGIPGPEFTITRGNNSYGYTDTDNNNVPDPGSSPDGGAALDFSFPLDLANFPSGYRPAAVTNAFYWANIVHNVLWNYGFDEPAGSFQVNNYGRGGADGDPVLVEVQDPSAVNNAFITSPPDGQSPLLTLGVWNQIAPFRDVALANGVIIDLYAYCAEERLVGGPITNCLLAAESSCMRWGWGDWIDLVLTANASDVASTPRGIATYLLGQPPSGPGIRPRRYTTDFAVNELTYNHRTMLLVPHGVGTIWGTMLWEMYWGLVDIHGFNPDIYGDWTTGGNNLALQLAIDGMKLAPCSPGFVDGRNAILAADEVLTGGANRCAIWRAFAVRGLGFSANQGSPASVGDGAAAFDLPPECDIAAVDDASSSQVPGMDRALRAYPNPFNPQANLSFTLERQGMAALEIYDLSGRLVRQIDTGMLAAGRHAVVWDGRGDANRGLASGEYVARLVIDGRVAATQKMMLVK